MAKVSFFVSKDKINKHGLAPIFMQVEHKGERFRYNTGKKIKPLYWSASKTRFTKPSYADVDNLSDYLLSLDKRVRKICEGYIKTGMPVDLAQVKMDFLKPIEPERPENFFTLYDQFMKQSSLTKAKSTIKNYRDTLFYFSDFKENNNFSFEFNLIDSDFYDRFLNYLIKDRGLANNTIGRVIKILKAFLTWSYDKGYHTNTQYKRFKALREDIDIVYLTYNELMAMYALQMPNSHLDKARDLFCFGCFTGLRFSDFTNIRPEHYVEGRLRIRTNKTDDPLTIPLIQEAENILRKHNFSLPAISNQKLNKYIKEVGEFSGLVQEVPIVKHSGGERFIRKEPKYKFISTHTARRTFITLSLERGVRAETLMKITGHKNLKSFQKYIKIIDTVAADELSRAWNK